MSTISRHLYWSLLVPLSAAFSGCAGEASPATPAARQALDEEFDRLTEGYNRETGARQVSAGDLLKRLSNGEKFVLLDIRESHEQAVSTLPEATLSSPDKIGAVPLKLPEDATIVTYCTAGYRSGVAAVALEKRFGRDVLNLSGGIIAWFNAGGTVLGPDGQEVDRIHPFGDEWAKYVHDR